MDLFRAWYSPRQPEDPRATCWDRFKNIANNNCRGIIGTLVPLFVLPFVISKKPHLIVLSIWMWMSWLFLVLPIATAVTALIPIFTFPSFGILSSVETCACYFNDMLTVMVVGGWVAMLLNHSGCERRFVLWLLTCNNGTITLCGLLFKTSLAAYLLSMICQSVMVTKHLTQYITAALINLKTSKAASDADGPNYDEIRCVICCAIFTSSSIGGTAILNASFPTLCAAGIWSEYPGLNLNVFNFLDYSIFAFPTSLAMFLLNLAYHSIVLKIVVKKEMSIALRQELTNKINRNRLERPQTITAHELCSFLAVLVTMALYFTRRNSYFGWASNDFILRDATVAVICCIAFCICPSDIKFIRIFFAKKESEISKKPSGPLLLFRITDKATDYGYMLLIGCGIALTKAVDVSKLNEEIIQKWAKFIITKNWMLNSLFIVGVTVLLSCLIPGTAVVVLFLPFIIHSKMANMHVACIGVGIAGSLGFLQPFESTPAYHCWHEGKVPIRKIVKYGIVSSLLCAIILWVALAFVAVKLFKKVDIPVYSNTTVGR